MAEDFAAVEFVDPFNGAFEDEEDVVDDESTFRGRNGANASSGSNAPPQKNEVYSLHSVGSIDRVRLCDIDEEIFRTKYGETNTPVVITEAQEILPMHLTLQYLKKNYASRQVILEIYSKDAQAIILEDYLQMYDASICQKYLRNLHLHKWFPEELEKISLPKIFGHNYLSDQGFADGCPESWRQWFELFINTRFGKGFPFLHRDVCSTHAFSMQIEGVKRFWMFPPQDTEWVYPSVVGGMHSTISDSFDSKELLKDYPDLVNTSPMILDLHPGELLFIPANYWHTTKTVSIIPSVTVGGNFVNGSNREIFLDEYADYAASLSLHGIKKVR